MRTITNASTAGREERGAGSSTCWGLLLAEDEAHGAGRAGRRQWWRFAPIPGVEATRFGGRIEEGSLAAAAAAPPKTIPFDNRLVVADEQRKGVGFGGSIRRQGTERGVALVVRRQRN